MAIKEEAIKEEGRKTRRYQPMPRFHCALIAAAMLRVYVRVSLLRKILMVIVL